MITRRSFLKAGGGLALGAMGVGTYAYAIEPGFMLNVARYKISPRNWPVGLNLKICVIADVHACEPHMGMSRLARIARLANAGAPDVILLLGDFNAGTRYVTGPIYPEQWAQALSVLKAPLGIHAVLGNHDWWHGPLLSAPSDDAQPIRKALNAMGARLYENDALRLQKDGHPFWLLGLGDQLARKIGYRRYVGHDDLSQTIRRIGDDAPAILMAHEPFIFDKVPNRIALTLCGHTHGGQVNLPFIGPYVANRRYGVDRVYGHHIEGDKHLIISAGLGESFLPIRFMRPPEIVEVSVTGLPGAIQAAARSRAFTGL